MKAVVHKDKKGFAGLTQIQDMPKPEPKKDEVRIRLRTAGLNHRDLFVLDRHDPEDPPFVIGSDGAGIVDTTGDNVSAVSQGDEVMVNPGLYWEKNSDAPPSWFEVLGFPNNGTFAEYVTVPASAVVKKPDYLSWEEAGVFSLAALTAYRALFTRGNLKAGMNVFIPGIGSGVATFLLLFAQAAGAKVYVSSRSKEKRQTALELGAEKALDSAEDWKKGLGGCEMDLVIECVGAATFTKSLDTLRKGGTIVTFGSSTGDKVEMDLRKFFYGQYNLLGSTMGSHEEYIQMLDFIQTHQIRPVMDRVYDLDDYEEAFKRLEEAKQLGKIAFKIS
ncbi:zinc-binding dehydrogenase [Alteribacter keqinensis]|uniref:NAD(P)-dependent alcohol dehydrogenase n=1 Tax=Alteribacter keqinensis TaxID=2483800 RepID=A0A3M7TW64_9BACI|nr:zinc-binding dehydrogenase [Alteribacter keqinensis]RNA69857.1 NAD(P)-dependent alcohol dehydrogenase [Alteribacter keqinensis]